jgi:cyclohexanecarboxylate-CoA ligase
VFRGFDHAEMARALRGDLPRLEHVFVARGPAPAGTKPFATLTAEAWEEREGRRSPAGTDPSRVHEVVFTSGTTGEPKGVMHALNTVLSTIDLVIDRLALSDRDVILMASTLGRPFTGTGPSDRTST